MRPLSRINCVCAILAGTTLAACGAGAPTAGVPIGALALTNALGAVPAHRTVRGKSWIRPDAGKEWLLYVSDGATGTIDIYNYRVKAGKLFGQITGLSFPYGQCVDRAGDVYVVDYTTAKIYEYAHGATAPIATANDDFGSPIGCSVDSGTGNVAVSNFNGPSSSAGGILVFAGGLNGTQSYFTGSQLDRFWPPGYDPSGNLFALGVANSSGTFFAELPAGKKTFTLLTGLSIAFPGSVAWDGSYLTAVDQNYLYSYTTMIYRVTVSGSKASVVRATELTDDCYPYRNFMVAVQPFVTGTARPGHAVVAGNLNCGSRENFFSYTNGGLPKRTLPASIAPVAPYGQSVSPPSSGS